MNYPLPGSTSYDTPITAVGNTFSLAKKATFSLPINVARNFQAKLGGLWIWVSAIAGGATTLTFRIALDAAGDELLVTDTEGALFPGTTTALDGSIVYSLNNLPVGLSVDELYLIVKTDAGTVTIDKTQLSWGF
tara:strand:+ start:73 stop:474 length:402 start_codon:yes stop_codon:yes gene_type:complete